MPKFIDRDKALSFPLANGKYDHEHANEHFIYGLETYKEWLEQLPTLSPGEVRGVGKWKQKEIYGVEETTIEQMQSACCSVCRKYHTTPYLYYFDKYNYCPNCGARMKGEQ